MGFWWLALQDTGWTAYRKKQTMIEIILQVWLGKTLHTCQMIGLLGFAPSLLPPGSLEISLPAWRKLKHSFDEWWLWMLRCWACQDETGNEGEGWGWLLFLEDLRSSEWDGSWFKGLCYSVIKSYVGASFISCTNAQPHQPTHSTYACFSQHVVLCLVLTQPLLCESSYWGFFRNHENKPQFHAVCEIITKLYFSSLCVVADLGLKGVERK